MKPIVHLLKYSWYCCLQADLVSKGCLACHILMMIRWYSCMKGMVNPADCCHKRMSLWTFRLEIHTFRFSHLPLHGLLLEGQSPYKASLCNFGHLLKRLVSQIPTNCLRSIRVLLLSCFRQRLATKGLIHHIICFCESIVCRSYLMRDRLAILLLSYSFYCCPRQQYSMSVCRLRLLSTSILYLGHIRLSCLHAMQWHYLLFASCFCRAGSGLSRIGIARFEQMRRINNSLLYNNGLHQYQVDMCLECWHLARLVLRCRIL